MHKKWSRRFAALLAACMLISLFPASALAAPPWTEDGIDAAQAACDAAALEYETAQAAYEKAKEAYQMAYTQYNDLCAEPIYQTYINEYAPLAQRQMDVYETELEPAEDAVQEASEHQADVSDAFQAGDETVTQEAVDAALAALEDAKAVQDEALQKYQEASEACEACYGEMTREEFLAAGEQAVAEVNEAAKRVQELEDEMEAAASARDEAKTVMDEAKALLDELTSAPNLLEELETDVQGWTVRDESTAGCLTEENGKIKLSAAAVYNFNNTGSAVIINEDIADSLRAVEGEKFFEAVFEPRCDAGKVPAFGLAINVQSKDKAYYLGFDNGSKWYSEYYGSDGGYPKWSNPPADLVSGESYKIRVTWSNTAGTVKVSVNDTEYALPNNGSLGGITQDGAVALKTGNYNGATGTYVLISGIKYGSTAEPPVDPPEPEPDITVTAADGTPIQAIDGIYTIPAGGKIFQNGELTASIPMGITSVAVARDAVSGVNVRANSGSPAAKYTTLTLPEGSETLLPDGTTVSDTALYCCDYNGAYPVIAPSIGLFVMSGSGAMDDFGQFGYESAPWIKNTWGQGIKTVKILDGVTYIGKNAFYNRKNLTDVSLAGSVQTIGTSAFEGCTELENISILQGVAGINDRAFSGCSSLSSVVIPDSVTAIGGWVFQSCENLKTVELPAGISTTGAQPFANCPIQNLVLRGAPGTIYSPELLFGAWGRTNDLTVYVNDGSYVTEDLSTALGKLNSYRIANLNGYTVNAYAEGGLAEPVQDGKAGAWYDEAGNALEKGADGVYVLPEDEEYGAVYTAGESQTEVLIEVSATAGGEKTAAVIEDGKAVILGGYTVYVNGGEIAAVPKGVVSAAVPVDAVSSLRVAESRLDKTTYYTVTLPEGSEVLLPDGTAVEESKLYCFAVNSTYPVIAPEAGLLVVSGHGAMKDYTTSASAAPWVYYYNYWGLNIDTIKILDGVTTVGNRSFNGFAHLTNVSMAGSVKTIGEYAFSDCTALESITIPEGAAEIKKYAFNGCSSLSSVVIPDSVTAIGGWVFQSCENLKTVELPAGVSTTGAQPFANCPIQNLVLRGAPGTIYSPELLFGAWGRTNDLTVYVNDGSYVTEDLSTALGKLNSYRIVNLNGYTVNAYAEGGLAEPVQDGKAGAWYDEAGNALEKGADGVYVLPEDEDYGAVYTAGEIQTEILIEVSATAGGEKTAAVIEDGKAVIPGGYTVYVNGEEIAAVPKGVVSVAVPVDAVSSLKVSRDTRNNVDIMTLPAGSETVFPDGSKVEDTKVYSCKSNNTYVTIGEQSGLCVVSGSGAMKDYKTASSGAPWIYNPWGRDCINTVRILDGVTYLGDYVFNNCTKLTQVVIPESVTAVGRNVFSGCSALTAIALPDGLTVIGTEMFKGCTALTQIDIPESVTLIKQAAFSGSGLTEITIPTEGTTLEMWVFESCTALKTVILPDGVNLNGAAIFRPKSGASSSPLKTIVFQGNPGNVKNDIFGTYGVLDGLMIYVSGSGVDTTNLVTALEKVKRADYNIANLNGGEIAEIKEGDFAVLKEREGLEFLGWFDEEENKAETPAGDKKTYIAKWAAIKVEYTVTIEGEAYTVEEGSALGSILPEEPVREGYTFQGWFDGETEVTAETPVTGDMTIEAKWELNRYTVTVDGTEYTVQHGDKLASVLPENPDREGYTFQGWFDGETEVTAETLVTGDMTIEAKWELNRYTVTVDGTEYTVRHGDKLASVLPENPVREGYTFQGWFDGETEVTAETLVTGDVTIEAKWELNRYTVTVDGTEYTVRHGDKLAGILPENPVQEGYTFQGWFDGETEVTAETLVTSDMTIEAKWELNRYTVTFDANGGTISGENTITVEHGKTVTALPSVSRSGYSFIGWFSGAIQFTAETVVTGDVTVEAQWSRNSSGGSSGGNSRPKPPTVEIEDPDTPLADLPFTDVGPDAWYEEAITYVYSKNLMQGSSDTGFTPDGNMDRGMMARVLYNLTGGIESGSVVLSFADVTEGTSDYEAILWAASHELVAGYGNGSFGPRDSITREQLALMLFRYAKFQGLDTTVDGQVLQRFADNASISDWAREAMAWAVSRELLVGGDDGCVTPAGTATRAQAAVVIMKFHQMVEKDSAAE